MLILEIFLEILETFVHSFMSVSFEVFTECAASSISFYYGGHLVSETRMAFITLGTVIFHSALNFFCTFGAQILV